MWSLKAEGLTEILVLGAHCDDIAIGAGGALLTLCRAHPGLRVSAVVFTGGGTAREAEEQAALAALCPGAQLKIEILDLRDGRLPSKWTTLKEVVEEVRRATSPELIFGPASHDAHQDHRTLAKLVPTAFRDHVCLGYEIVKWESDLKQPQVFLPLDNDVLERKLDVLFESYPSQHRRTWFDRENFMGLARIRGIQSGARYAEAFHATKLLVAP